MHLFKRQTLLNFGFLLTLSACDGSTTAPTVNSTTGPAISITTAPTVSSTTPLDLATSVALDSTITATFDKDMFATTVDASSFTLDQSGAIGGTVTFEASTNVATFTPSSELAGNAVYTATLGTSITDLSGNPLAADYSWSFTTIGAPFEENLMAHYAFDGDFVDKTGINPTPCGTPIPTNNADNGASRGIDRFGNVDSAAYFDGDRDFLDCGNAFSFVGKSWTVSVWTKYAATTGSRWILSKGSGSGTNSMMIVGLAGGAYSFTNDFYANYFNASQSYPASGWNHWVVSYDYATGERTIYRDGALENQGVGSGGATSYLVGDGNLTLGGWWLGVGDSSGKDWYNGGIDELRVYDTVLSDSDVGALYAAEKPPADDPLVLWLDGSDVNGDGTTPLDGSSIVSWKDKSSSANHLEQADGAKQPTFVANSQNSMGAVHFWDQAKSLSPLDSAQLPAGAGGKTYILVYRADDPSDPTAAGPGYPNGNILNYGGDGIGVDAHHWIRLHINKDQLNYDVNSYAYQVSMTNSGYHVFTLTIPDVAGGACFDQWRFYRDQALLTVPSGNCTYLLDTKTDAPLVFGRWGAVAEMRVFNVALSDADRVAQEEALRVKWGTPVPPAP
jgi:hypothetical protein